MKNAIIVLLCLLFSCFSGSALAATISGDVTYDGPCTGTVIVAAFDGDDCGQGAMVDEVRLPGPGPYTLNVGAGSYYICSCMDTNGNGTCPDEGPDEAEPAGEYVCNPEVVSSGGDVITGVEIELPDEGPCPRPTPIPTMTGWGMIILSLLFLLTAAYFIRRKKSTT